jgi:transposase-like protein
MNTVDGRRRRCTHSAEFKAQVVAACRAPGVSIAAVALANGLNANLLRRWVVSGEEAPALSAATLSAPPAELEVDGRAFIPIEIEPSMAAGNQQISVELRRGATVVKVAWPLAGAAACAAWLRELVR